MLVRDLIKEYLSRLVFIVNKIISYYKLKLN